MARENKPAQKAAAQKETDKAHVATVQASTQPGDPVKFFDDKVRPVLAQNCYKCHTSEAMGGLRLDSRESILKGGDSGPRWFPAAPTRASSSRRSGRTPI